MSDLHAQIEMVYRVEWRTRDLSILARRIQNSMVREDRAMTAGERASLTAQLVGLELAVGAHR